MSEQENFEKLRQTFPMLEVFKGAVDRVIFCRLLNSAQKDSVLSALPEIIAKKNDLFFLRNKGENASQYSPKKVQMEGETLYVENSLDGMIALDGDIVAAVGEKKGNVGFFLGVFGQNNGVIAQMSEGGFSNLKDAIRN